MKYVIWAHNTSKFRTTMGWISTEKEIQTGERLLALNSRKKVDDLIRTGGFIHCESYAISPSHPLYKYC